ncbi:MAG TPA: PKD domain-containing protein [Solirubrobacterales bacterium]|nr:PKD domain-containing protein [Solirubrobacterales bacterium]
MVDRRRLATGVLALCALASVALMEPALASARVAYFTGASSSGMGSIAAPVELTTQAIGGQVPIGMSSEGTPADVAITPDGKTAYVVDNEQVVPIDVATNTAGTPIAIPIFGQAIAIAPDGRFAYVSSVFVGPSEISKIDLATKTVVATIAVGDNAFGLAVTPDSRTLYVASNGDGSVYPVDVATNVVGAAIPVGPFPSAVSVTPDGSSAYVLLPGEEKLVRIDLATNTVVGAIANVPGSELAIAPNGAKAYAVGGSAITPVDLGSGAAGTTSFAPNQDSFEDVAILPDGSRAYATTQHNEASLFTGLMTPVLTAGDALQPSFPLNTSFVGALAIVPNQPPRAEFSVAPQPGKAMLPVSFDAAASADTDGGSVVRYDWDFGDGSSAANGGASPQHTYAQPGTYTVTLTVTDNEGCSVSMVFPGQTAYCNGSSIARTTRTVVVERNLCPQVKAGASTFIPKRRPGKVLPGVRVRLSTGVPARLTVTARLIYRRNGKEASAGLGTISADVNRWRRVRFAVPPGLRQELPLGKRVKVELRIETAPKGGAPCETTVVNRTLKVHVVKVFPNRVQAERPR